MSLETINLDHLVLPKGAWILDLGCGEGRHSISTYLLRDVHVVGLDISTDDLNTATQRLQDFPSKETSSASCNFVCASGHALPFANHYFDAVICSEVLEHIPDYPVFLKEIKRVLKPGGTFAASVPTYFPEWVCWKLSDAYHEVEGGHVRIFKQQQLKQAITQLHMQVYKKHKAHSLHVPYWWLRCLFWDQGAEHPIVASYHKFLVWDLLQKPKLTQFLDQLLNPLLGKSVVMYFVNQHTEP